MKLAKEVGLIILIVAILWGVSKLIFWKYRECREVFSALYCLTENS